MLSKNSYLHIIAGAVPVHDQGALEDTAALLAREALGTEQVHVLLAKDKSNSRVVYFGLPSSALAGESSPVTPLAAALPGHPDHKGDGVYLLDVAPYKVVAVYYDEVLTVLCNNATHIEDYIADLGLPVYPVDNAIPWRFESAYTIAKKSAENITSRINKFSMLMAGSAILIFLLAKISAGMLSKTEQRSTAEFENSVKNAVSEIRTSSPLTEQLATFQAKASTTVRAGGWIDYYQVKDGVESFRIYMPQWVTRDYILSFGNEAKADLTAASEDLVQIVKGKPVDELIKVENPADQKSSAINQ